MDVCWTATKNGAIRLEDPDAAIRALIAYGAGIVKQSIIIRLGAKANSAR